MPEAGPVAFLSGRYFTAEEIKPICKTVQDFSALPWYELVQTICEHLEWVTPAGRNKTGSCANALSKLEQEGLLKLPATRAWRVCSQKVTQRRVVRKLRQKQAAEGLGRWPTATI